METELGDFIVGMIGTDSDPSSRINLKAKEAEGFAMFLVLELLPRVRHMLDPVIGGNIFGAGESLLEYLAYLRTCSMQPNLQESTHLMQLGLKHLRLSLNAGVP